ncbi:MAG: molecular chaperone GrpE [Candidatus Endobugula sp.]
MSNEHEDNVSEVISDTLKQDPVQASDAVVIAGVVEDVAEGDLMSDSVSDVLVEEITDLKEQVLRAHAETQNARRRAEQDVEKARKFALEKLVADLLPVADNLERAISAGDSENESQKAVLEGVALTLKSLQDTLKKYKVEMIDPAGEPFDPQLHQAMTMLPNPDVEPNTVLNVFQKGYTLNGRLVRPAMVVVSKAP